MMKYTWLPAALIFSSNYVVADDIIRLQCEATSKSQTSFKSAEAGRTTLAVDVVVNGQAVRRVIVYGENKRLAVVEAAKTTQLKNHTAVDTSDPRRWSIYNTWEDLHGDPSSARVNIDRSSGDIAFEAKVHTVHSGCAAAGVSDVQLTQFEKHVLDCRQVVLRSYNPSLC